MGIWSVEAIYVQEGHHVRVCRVWVMVQESVFEGILKRLRTCSIYGHSLLGLIGVPLSLLMLPFIPSKS
jgi:hypothetical protein